MERIVDERLQSRTYFSLDDWKVEHPDCSPIANVLVESSIKERGSHTDYLPLNRGEYSWGDYTEIKFWGSSRDFAKEHAQSHPIQSVREHFIADLAQKMAPRFKQGYLIEVAGLRDKDGRDMSSAMLDEKCPSSVYHVEMERREYFLKRTQETSVFLRKSCEAQKSSRTSRSSYIGVPFRAVA